MPRGIRGTRAISWLSRAGHEKRVQVGAGTMVTAGLAGGPSIQILRRVPKWALAEQSDSTRTLGLRGPMKLLAAEDVAASWGVTAEWLYAQARSGAIPHVRLGRYVRFREESLVAWMEQRERESTKRGN